MNDSLSRRAFLGVTLGAAANTLIPRDSAYALAEIASADPARGAKGIWPAMEAWERLRKDVGGRLISPKAPWASLEANSAIPADLKNPWFLEESAGATQSTGMFSAWKSEVSPFAVAAENAQDIAKAVNFAREHRIRLVVKGTGHDYFGRSCAADSLLVWTHPMRRVEVHDAFRPQGAPESLAPVHALSVQAGNRWLEAYQAATAAGRYVQGGGCTSVGACGGFALGGGFGSFSKRFGSGAGGVLEIEVITADGRVRVVNAHQEPELFWAMRGGGGGTFGVVSRMTLLTHPMPTTDGWLSGSITAKTDAAYRELLRRYIEFVPAALNHPAWGEGVLFVKGEKRMNLGTAFLDLSAADAERIWAPLLDPLRSRPSEFEVDAVFTVQPFREKWNPAGKSSVVMDDRPGAPKGYFWWAGNGEEVGAYWGAYQGRGVPLDAMRGANAGTLADAMFEATRTSAILWQTNKALSGEPPEARARDELTALNPVVFSNAAFVTLGDWVQYKYVGVPGHEPDEESARDQLDGVNRAMSFVKAATPGGGSYSNEGDYFEENWRQEFWGSNYERLLAVKREVDPTNLFHVHHGVGSEE